MPTLISWYGYSNHPPKADNPLSEPSEYKIVSEVPVALSYDPSHEDFPRKSLKQTLNDPIAKILVEESNLTPIQFQTFLIYQIIKRNKDGGRHLEWIPHVRVDKAEISRGSFNRTLDQAVKNIIRSIYTVFLLGYVGIFDSPTLDPFIEVSGQIRSYLERLRSGDGQLDSESTQTITVLCEELRKVIQNLAKVKKFGSL